METGWNSINGEFHASYCKEGIAVGPVDFITMDLVQGWIFVGAQDESISSMEACPEGSANCAHSVEMQTIEWM